MCRYSLPECGLRRFVIIRPRISLQGVFWKRPDTPWCVGLSACVLVDIVPARVHRPELPAAPNTRAVGRQPEEKRDGDRRNGLPQRRYGGRLPRR